MTDEQLKLEIDTLAGQQLALLTAVRLLISTHPNPAALQAMSLQIEEAQETQGLYADAAQGRVQEVARKMYRELLGGLAPR